MQKRSTNNIKLIDVSHHQETIDWQKVAKTDVKGVMIKATEGRGYVDPVFRRNAVGAPAVGLKVGFYHYARPETGNSPVQEAESFTNAIKQLPSDLPHALDLEGAASALGREDLTEWAYQWLTEVKKRTGHKVMLYTGGSFAKTYCGAKLAEFPLWIAHYGVDTPMPNNTWGRWSVFQYTSGGRVDGISSNVDMNAMELDFWMSLTEEELPFQDVPKTHWAYSLVKQAKEQKIISGYPDGTFKPDQPITRAEALALVMKKGDK